MTYIKRVEGAKADKEGYIQNTCEIGKIIDGREEEKKGE